MTPPAVRALGLLFLCASASVHAAVDYATIADTNAIVTGVRSDSATSDSVVLTANYTTNGVQYAGLYDGSLVGAETAPTSAWNALTPVIPIDPQLPNGPKQTVTAATFYGPNTNLFDPRLGAGNIIAVGSYKYSESAHPAFDHGLLYIGPVDGVGGTWKQIDATPLITGIRTLKNTIAHSTMGDLVVGNYDTDIKIGNAFIYNRITDEWTDLNPGNTASVTAYGIWQNGGSGSTSYTICGGQSNVLNGELDTSYLVDYDSATKALTNYRVYTYNNQPASAALCHFDGITATSTGFNLTGIVTVNGAIGGFFASVPVNSNGSFGDATWVPIGYSGASQTTGNTVVGNHVLGIFINGGTQSYLATVQPQVAVSVVKSGLRATFTITNTGPFGDNFTLSRQNKITNSYRGPAPATPGRAPFQITYTLNGANITNALPAGTAVTGALIPGASVKVVQKVKATRRVAFKRTIRAALSATSQTNPATSASAKTTLVLKPQ